MLGFAQYGPEMGTPVFYFTGGNSSRLEGRWFAAACDNSGVNLVVPDRPGFGLSDFQPGRRFLDWPSDVLQLAERLGIERFAVLGLSGGAPHVAVLLLEEPRRIRAAAIVSGVAPPEMPNHDAGVWPPVRLLFSTARWLPAANRFLLGRMQAFYADREKMATRMKQSLPRPDVDLLSSRPDVAEVFSAAAREAHRNGVIGDGWEWQMYVRPWGFRIADIEAEVGLWYGEVDKNVPAAMGRYWASRLPKSVLNLVPDGGHFSTINNHIEQIFEYLRNAR